MFCVSKDKVIVDGSNQLVATELAMLFYELRQSDKEIIPVALATVYTDGGDKDISLDDALKEFKSDTSMILDRLKKIEERK